MTNLPAIPTDDAFREQLIKAGFISEPSAGPDINRLRVVGSNINLGDEIVASYNAKTKEAALTVQLLDMPVQYQSMWFGKDGKLAYALDRPEIAGQFCRSYFDNPAQARKYAEDGTSCDTCKVSPFRKYESLPPEAIAQDGASKCSWRGEIEFRILNKNDDGTFNADDETIYTMSLPTTAMIEFVGSNSKNQDRLAGSVSPHHFMAQLAVLGMNKWGDDGLRKALTFLRLGGVIAEIRLLPASNKDKGYNYSVTSFTPIEILDMDEQPQIESAETPVAAATDDSDSVPF